MSDRAVEDERRAAGKLRVSLFGRVQIAHDGVSTATAPTRVVQNLLAYLLLQRHRIHSRESLLGTFWGEHDEQAARNCLNTALWRLRRVLEPPGIPRGTYIVTTSAGEVGFNDQSPYWLDVEELERHASAVCEDQSVTAATVANLERAVDLYFGDILDGVYDDWALRERERLRALYLNSRAWLMRYHACHGAPKRGIAHAEEILRHDPLREEIHRDLIRLYLATGARARAARQYEVCQRALAEELGIEPMPETRSVVASINGGARTRSDGRVSNPGNFDALTLELRGAARSVERALAYLRDVVGRVEEALGSVSHR